jgi:serine/threonine protein phosphatase PrpC
MAVDSGQPILGRASPASSVEPSLPAAGDAAGASWRIEGGGGPWFRLRAVSVAGVRHRLGGDRCEDWFAWSHQPSRLIVSIADGVGSTSGAAGAAQRAALSAVSVGEKGDAPEDGQGMLVREAVAAANEAAGEGEGSTTVVVASITPEGRVDLARVGDSTAFLVTADGAWSELFEGPDAEQARNVTNALPAADPRIDTVSTTIAIGDVLVLATDGVADPWRDGPSTVAPFLASALLSRPSALKLGWLADFSRQGCHDDRTMACFWLAP